MSSPPFEVVLTFQGRTERVLDVTTETTGQELANRARDAFSLDDNVALKLLFKGKVLQPNQVAFHSPPPPKRNKILIMASSNESVQALNNKRSDPTIRGFNQEETKKSVAKNTAWGPNTCQDKNYKFCHFQACTWQSFGHRADGSNTPHAFQAMQLLERLATDPGVVAIMKERELVVGTLGEMDPIDDRLKQKHQAKGSCLLGYNTNAGARIDVKLRPDSLKGFLPYRDIASTLIHELSHNWVGEHNALFWTNFGQMRVEYLHRHATMAASGTLVNGKTTTELAGVTLSNGMDSIAEYVMRELEKDMAQHGLHPRMIAPAILERCQQLTQQFEKAERGQRVGGSANVVTDEGSVDTSGSARERALAAAERRAAQQQQRDEEQRANGMKKNDNS